MLETTGIADPSPILSALWLDDALQSNIKLDGVVVCVDALNFNSGINDKPTDMDTSISERYIEMPRFVC